MGDGEDALWDEENALGDEDEEDTTPWEEDTSSDSKATSPSSETFDKEAKEANRSPASICTPNSNSCFTKGGQVHIHVHVTGEDVAGLSGRLECRMQRALELSFRRALRSIANRTLRKNFPNRTPRTLLHSSSIH
jgi:hypothetical protein